MLNEPSPSFTKKARRSTSLFSPGTICFSSGMNYLEAPADTGAFGLSGLSIASTDINPVGSAETRLYDSIVIVPTGQRMAHSPQRIQRVSSFNMADPVTIP